MPDNEESQAIAVAEAQPGPDTLTTVDFLAMDAADEEQVLDLMRGRVVEDWVYEVRGVKQLTLVGIEEAALLYGRKQGKGIDVNLVKEEWSSDGSELRILMKATDLATGASAYGAKAQPTSKDFYYESCVSKAERNAKRKLLPVSFLKAIIQAAVEKGKVRILSAPTPIQKWPGKKPVPAMPAPGYEDEWGLKEPPQEAAPMPPAIEPDAKADLAALVLSLGLHGKEAWRAVRVGGTYHDPKGQVHYPTIPADDAPDYLKAAEVSWRKLSDKWAASIARHIRLRFPDGQRPDGMTDDEVIAAIEVATKLRDAEKHQRGGQDDTHI